MSGLIGAAVGFVGVGGLSTLAEKGVAVYKRKKQLEVLNEKVEAEYRIQRKKQNLARKAIEEQHRVNKQSLKAERQESELWVKQQRNVMNTITAPQAQLKKHGDRVFREILDESLSYEQRQQRIDLFIGIQERQRKISKRANRHIENTYNQCRRELGE